MEQSKVAKKQMDHQFTPTAGIGSSPIKVDEVIARLKKISNVPMEQALQFSETKVQQTIEEMVGVIKTLEGDLATVLQVNQSLKTEALQLKIDNAQLQTENSKTQTELQQIKAITPKLNDVEKRLDMSVEELEKMRTKNQQLEQAMGQTTHKIKVQRHQIEKITDERNDALKELSMLRSKINF